LCSWRLKRAYGWILYISVLLAAPVTAVGAVIPFVGLSPWGASLTMDSRSVSTGIFQGATGGIVWGSTVSLGVLVYAVIWRGGRVRNSAREAVAMALSGMTGAAIGGIANSAVIALVLHPTGLYNSGWFSRPDLSPTLTERLVQVLVDTKYGWSMVIFGAALGLGIGWALSVIISDGRERWKTNNPFANARTAGRAVKTIAMRVIRESWRVALCLAAGAALIWWMIEPGPGFCNASAHVGNALPSTCAYLLPPAWVRVAGLGIVIYGGCVGQQIAFLFGLLSIQFGMDLWKNLPVNPYFMRTAAPTVGQPH
jgi:hypothetical protein